MSKLLRSRKLPQRALQWQSCIPQPGLPLPKLIPPSACARNCEPTIYCRTRGSSAIQVRSLSSQSKDSIDHQELLEIEPLSILYNDDTDDTANQSSPPEQGTMDRATIRRARSNILKCCEKPTLKSATQAQREFQALAQESIRTGKPLVNLALHNSILNAWAKCGDKTAFLRACNFLDMMKQRHKEYPHAFPMPNTISYHCALNACVRSASNHPDASSKADDLIKEMEQMSLKDSDGPVHPTTNSYNFVIGAHANQAPHKYGAANAAEDWLRYLSKSGTEGGPGPDSVSFNNVLKAWKASPEDKAADRALELLQLMIKLFKEGHQHITPDGYSFGTVIHAFSKRNRPDEAEDVLKLALDFFFDSDFAERAPPETIIDLRVSFNTAIDGWAKSDNPDAPQRADALLQDMLSLSQETQLILTTPDAFSYTSCMEAMAKSGRPDAPEIVESKLYSMLENSRSPGFGNHGQGISTVPRPSPATFDCAISTWYRSERENRPERMEALLNLEIELSQRCDDPKLLPLPRTVNTCLTAWCRDGKAKTKAMNLLNRMEVIGCVDGLSYVTLINALTDTKNNKDNDSAFAAAEVLDKLLAQIKYRKTVTWPYRKPREIFKKVLFALLQVGNGEAADKAYAILEEIETNHSTNAKPSCDIYSVVIAALSKVPNPERTQKALDIFNHLLRLHDDPKVTVNADTKAFLAILTCLANAIMGEIGAENQKKAADKARSLFNMQLDMYRKNPNNEQLRPNFRCYDKCIQATARCNDLESLRLAVNMLKRFVDDFRKEGQAPALPSEVGINTVLKFCILEGSGEALALAKEVETIKQDLLEQRQLIANLSRKEKES